MFDSHRIAYLPCFSIISFFGILRIFFYPFLVILAEKIAFEEWKGWRMTNA
jgi:hypothetical protein